MNVRLYMCTLSVFEELAVLVAYRKPRTDTIASHHVFLYSSRGRMIRYGCLFVIMPRAELSRYTVIVLSVILSVCCKYFSSLTEN